MVKVLFKCEHCASFYQLKSRAAECGKKHGFLNPWIAKYVGKMNRLKEFKSARRLKD